MAVYATSADLAEYLAISQDDLPEDVDRLLARASEEVDYLTLNRVDTTETTHVTATKAAACALCEYWIRNAADTAATVASYTIGKLTVNQPGASTVPIDARTTARVRFALMKAGLLYRGVAQAHTSVPGESSF